MVGALQKQSRNGRLFYHGLFLCGHRDDVEVSGKAMCGFCYWGVGGTSCNVVLKTASAPGVVFLSPNAKVNEIEKITGKCAGGKVEIRARGMLSQYDDHNYLFVRNFEKV